MAVLLINNSRALIAVDRNMTYGLSSENNHSLWRKCHHVSKGAQRTSLGGHADASRPRHLVRLDPQRHRSHRFRAHAADRPPFGPRVMQPDQVPLRSGISSCARAAVATVPSCINANTKHLIAFLRFDRRGFRRTSLLPLFRPLARTAVL